MLPLGRIQVRKRKETEKCKCASCGAYFAQLSSIVPSGVKWALRSGPGLQHGSKQRQDIPHLPYSPNIAPADFFLFPQVKSQLADLTLSQDTLKTSWEGVMQTITEDEFAIVFQ
jgi:hypothetical protein